MKLLYINDELATNDGSNAHAIGMLNAFKEELGNNNVYSFPQAKDGSKVIVDVKRDKVKQRLKGVLQYIRYIRKKFLSFKRYRKYVKELKKNNFTPTHVLARSTVFDITAIYIARYFNAKLIYEVNTPMYYECTVIRNMPLKTKIEKWEKKIINESDYIYVVSNVCRDMLCDYYNLNNEKFIVIPNGYMKELYCENEKEKNELRKEIRKKEGIEGKFVVAFIGSLKVWHGIREFCDVAKRLEDNQNIHFLVIGDGEMRAVIESYVNKHNNMSFAGKLSYERMKEYLYSSDIGIMPYKKQDNFYFSPLKMYEMIGASLPFIGTNQAQIMEIVNAYFCDDFLVDDNFTESLALKIDNIFRDEKRYRYMCKIINNNKEKFTWNKRVKELIEQIY